MLTHLDIYMGVRCMATSISTPWAMYGEGQKFSSYHFTPTDCFGICYPVRERHPRQPHSIYNTFSFQIFTFIIVTTIGSHIYFRYCYTPISGLTFSRTSQLPTAVCKFLMGPTGDLGYQRQNVGFHFQDFPKGRQKF